MFGLALNENNDIYIEGTEFKRTYDGAYVAQKVKVMLQTVEGESTTDPTFGIPYFDDIFIKPTNTAYIASVFKTKILGVEGVNNLLGFNYDYDNTTRTFSIDFSIDTDYGEIDVTDFTVGEVL